VGLLGGLNKLVDCQKESGQLFWKYILSTSCQNGLFLSTPLKIFIYEIFLFIIILIAFCGSSAHEALNATNRSSSHPTGCLVVILVTGLPLNLFVVPTGSDNT